MLDEHESGRRHVAAMAATLERAAAGDAPALAAFERHAGDLDALLREHIAKEDQVLFPMAEDLLDGAAGDALLADFRRIEADAGARHRTWLSRLDTLCDRCAVARLDRSRVPTIAREFL
jgi:hemerythrin-like domain-containing protein